MDTARVASRPVTIPLIVIALLLAGLAVVVESQLKLGVKLPGHRAFPGALVLSALAFASPRTLYLGFALVVGVVIAALTSNPFVLAAWALPALLLAFVQPTSTWARVAIAIAAGLAFGLLRWLTLPEGLHHTPALIRLGGHLGFGALGAVGVALAPRAKVAS
jgi:hypothetical protein